MRTLSIGKLRGLQQCSSSSGTFTCLALDHRQNLRRALNPTNPASVSDADLTRFKLEVTAELGEVGTAVLLDPQFSAAQAIAGQAIQPHTPFVVAVESTGYGGSPTARQSQVLPGWSIEKAKRMGASMVKLLVYYHPDSPTAAEIEHFVTEVVQDCSRYDMGIMLEPLSYSLQPDQPLSSSDKRYVVVETARRLASLGIDLLKAEFPLDVKEPDEQAWNAACAEISAASPVPWILLSAAVDFDLFARQVAAACQAGASGCAVGRAVWQEAVSLDGAQRAEFLQATARPRLEKLSGICQDLGKSWKEFFEMPVITPDWYKNY